MKLCPFSVSLNATFRGIWQPMPYIAWLQAWQTIYNSRPKCRRVREKRQPKTSACYFSIGTLAPDTAEPWRDARTVIWRIPLVLWPWRCPFYRKCDMRQWGQRSEGVVMASVVKALQLATVSGHKPPRSLHMTSWTSCCFWKVVAHRHLWRWNPPTWRRRNRLSSQSVKCHVHQHPPPTNGLIWPPPTNGSSTSLMPNRPARGLLSEGEGASAWIPQSNLNM